MKQTVEAIIDERGHVRLTEPIFITGIRRALLTVLDEPPSALDETLLSAEQSLAADWLRSEEDDAWAHLQ